MVKAAVDEMRSDPKDVIPEPIDRPDPITIDSATDSPPETALMDPLLVVLNVPHVADPKTEALPPTAV